MKKCPSSRSLEKAGKWLPFQISEDFFFMSGNKPFGESKYILFMLGILLRFSLSWFGDYYSEHVGEIICENTWKPILDQHDFLPWVDSSVMIISVGSVTTLSL